MILFSASIKLSPLFNMALPISECATPQKLSVDIYHQLKTSFILWDDEVNSLKKHSETAPSSISSVLVKCTKTEYFSHGGTCSNFASDFLSRQVCQNAVNHVF